MSINNTILVEKHYIPLNLYKELYPSPNNSQSIMPSFNSTTTPPPVAQPYYDISNSPILNTGLNSIYTPLRRYYFNSSSVPPTTTAASTANNSTSNNAVNDTTATTDTTPSASVTASETRADSATGVASATDVDSVASATGVDSASVDNIYDSIYNDTFNYYSNLFNINGNNRTSSGTDNIWGPTVAESTTPATTVNNDNNNTTTRTDNINGVNYSTRTTQRRTPRGYVSFEVSTAAFPHLDTSTTTTNFINSLFRNLGGLNLNTDTENQNYGLTDTENQNYGLTEQEIFNNTENYIANFEESKKDTVFYNDTDDDNIDDIENDDNVEQSATETDIDTTCSICHDEMVNGQRLKRILNCNHSFHQQCIEPWFANHNTCPLCRTRVVRDEST